MPYLTTTRATLRTRLQERYESLVFWSDTEANDALNEALRLYAAFTGYWRGSATVATTANDPFLTVPASLTYRSRVYRSGKALTRKSILEQFRTRRNWRTETTTTGGSVPTTVREWSPIGLRTIALWPADAAGGTAITIDAVKLTPILTLDADTVDIGEEELGAILDEAIWVLVAFKRPSMAEAVRPRHQAFLRACAVRNDRLRASSYYRRVLGLDVQQGLRATQIPDGAAP